MVDEIEKINTKNLIRYLFVNSTVLNLVLHQNQIPFYTGCYERKCLSGPSSINIFEFQHVYDSDSV